MTKRTGKDIFIQHVERLFANKAPTIYFLDTYFRECGMVYDVVTDVVNNLTGKYRSRRALIDEETNKVLSMDYQYRRSGIKANGEIVGALGPTPDGIKQAIEEIGGSSGLTTDRNLLLFSAFNEKFSAPGGGYSMSPLIDFAILSELIEHAKKQRTSVELVPIYRVGHHSTLDARFNPECSVVIQTFNGVEFITLFGSKPDEVYMFAYRGTYEPISISANIDYEYAQKVIEHSENRRMMLFNVYSEFNLNPFTVYMPGISAAAYYAIPQYTEKFTLLDAANTPLDELFKLAANVENGLTVFCNSQPNLKSGDIVEEAGLAWREGKYVSLTDSIQPGFSRSGTFMYKSERLKDLVVVSYNLLLEKEKS